MNISIDAGGLASPYHYGNYTFTQNLLEGLFLYDKKNLYTAYTLYRTPENVKNITFLHLSPHFAWMKLRVPLQELTHRKDYFLALNSAIPSFTRSKIISFLHGLSFLQYPQFYRDSISQLTNQLEQSMAKSEYVIVSSQRVRKELAKSHKQFIHKVKVLPFGIPLDFAPVKKRHHEVQPYFVYTGMNHPIKNIAFIIDCFNTFIADKRFSNYELYLVGPHDNFKSKNIRIIKGISRTQLMKIYQNTTSYLTASLYESFNFPVVEALSQGSRVIGLETAIIPELKKYVSVAYDKEQYLNFMKESAMKDVIIDTQMLAKRFSWEHYINQLCLLY